MTLVSQIRSLTDRVVDDLKRAHDYYSDTKMAWRIVHDFSSRGFTFSQENEVTGTITNQDNISDKARGYIAEQLTEATFQQFISIFEDFFFEMLRLWLTEYPEKLSGKQIEVKAILDAPDKDAIITIIVDKELNSVLYKQPIEWFKYLDDLIKLGCPTEEKVSRIAEAKVSRDMLVHNRGIANKTYEAKARAAARYRMGERIEIQDQYHLATWNLLHKVDVDISNAAIAKFD